MISEDRLKRMKYRAWHRGTKEADMMIGGYYDRYHSDWDAVGADWFEALLDEEDVDIMAWAIGVQPAPPRYHGDMLAKLQRLDFIKN
jgi:antitoxin CptB